MDSFTGRIPQNQKKDVLNRNTGPSIIASAAIRAPHFEFLEFHSLGPAWVYSNTGPRAAVLAPRNSLRNQNYFQRILFCQFLAIIEF
jgi:hypothetical protein